MNGYSAATEVGGTGRVHRTRLSVAAARERVGEPAEAGSLDANGVSLAKAARHYGELQLVPPGRPHHGAGAEHRGDAQGSLVYVR